MKFTIFNRNFSDLVIQPNLEFEVERYSWGVIGGPQQATVIASGEREALFEMVNHLRGPVEIRNEDGNQVWWGYISNIQISWKAIDFGVDIETMFNSVAVAYTDQNLRFTTDWSEDSESAADYGVKEILLSKADATQADALQLRDTFLARAKHPIPTLQFAGSDSGVIRITCSGWLKTLDWQYYVNSSGKESYEMDGKGGREIGEDDRPILAQSFEISSATDWDATSIWLKPWKQGTSLPTDNLVVALKSDDAGDPGTTLASGSLAAADIGDQSEWLEFELDSAVTLVAGTTYWIHVSRSGSVAASNYFMVDTNIDSGYANGIIKLYNTNLSKWVEEGARWGDLLFKVVGNLETTAQIETLVTACGDFYKGTILEVASGIESNPFRDGDSSALYELMVLLNVGTMNSRRLLCETSHNRYLRVYEEPTRPTVAKDSHALNQDGKLLTSKLADIDPTLCPVGIWCHLEDVIPSSVDLSMVANPSLFFIDESEYDVKNGEYHVLRTRDQSDVLDIGGAVQG